MPYCRKCKTEKPEAHFEPDSRTQTGFAIICIACKGYSGETKVCPKCKNERPIEYYFKSHPYCKMCIRIYNKKFRDSNPEKFKEYIRKSLQSETVRKNVRESIHKSNRFIYNDEHSLSYNYNKEWKKAYLSDYENTPKRRLYNLRKLLRKAKTEKTVQNLKKQIEELELLINKKQ